MTSKNVVGHWMKREVFSIKATSTLREAASILAEKRIGTLPVVDDSDYLIGITTMRDILKLFLPDFLSLMENVDFVKSYGALRDLSPEDIEKADSMTVGDVMHEAVSVEQGCGLVRALSLMKTHSLSDLPVLRDEKLVGLVSRVDIGRALLQIWLKKEPVKAA